MYWNTEKELINVCPPTKLGKQKNAEFVYFLPKWLSRAETGLTKTIMER